MTFRTLNFVSIIYDVLAVVIVINCISRGAKNGFAKTAVQTVGYICSVIAALVVSSIASALLYSTVIEPALVAHLENSITNAVDAQGVVDGLVSAVENLPAISYLLFDFSDVAQTLSGSVSLDYAAIAENVSDAVIRPVLEPIIKVIIFALTAIILFAVVSIVAKGSKVVNDVPVIGKANSFFGGIFGIANGALELCVGALIIRTVISSGMFPEYFSEEIIEKTFLFKNIYFTVCGYIF